MKADLMPVSSHTLITCRKAARTDIDAVCSLLAEPAQRREILPRSRESVELDIGNFLVAETGEKLVGCVTLRDYDNGLFEVRSLVVDRRWNGLGIGTQLLDEALAEAGEEGATRVFALTYRPNLFKRRDFTVVPKSHFPQKVWEDCRHCSDRDNCREIAVVKNIGSNA